MSASPNVGSILETLASKGISPAGLAAMGIRQPEMILQLIAGLDAKRAAIKFGCAKTLFILSEQAPEHLLPHWDFFVRLLDHENTILRWNAIRIVGRLAGVDRRARFERIFQRYFAPITGPVMITAANIVAGGTDLVLVRPSMAEDVVREFLKVARARYQTAECRNVALGHVIVALDRLWDSLPHKAPLLRFVRRHLKNPRSSTRKKAEAFLARHAGG